MKYEPNLSLHIIILFQASPGEKLDRYISQSWWPPRWILLFVQVLQRSDVLPHPWHFRWQQIKDCLDNQTCDKLCWHEDCKAAQYKPIKLAQNLIPQRLWQPLIQPNLICARSCSLRALHLWGLTATQYSRQIYNSLWKWKRRPLICSLPRSMSQYNKTTEQGLCVAHVGLWVPLPLQGTYCNLWDFDSH